MCKKKRNTKVLFFITWPGGGGAEQVMVTLLCSLNRKQIDPVLMLLQPYDASPCRQMLPNYMRVVVNGRGSDSDLSKLKQAIDLVMCIRREIPGVIVSMLTHNNLICISMR